MSEELKPCPFCKCEVEWSPRFLYDSGAKHPAHSECALRGMVFPADKWNTRAYEAELAALREENERLRQLMQLLYEQVRYMPSRNITTIG